MTPAPPHAHPREVRAQGPEVALLPYHGRTPNEDAQEEVGGDEENPHAEHSPPNGVGIPLPRLPQQTLPDARGVVDGHQAQREDEATQDEQRSVHGAGLQ